MTTYLEIAQALVDAGYLTEADVEAAVTVLEDALIVAAANDAQEAASEDYADQEDLVAEAGVWANEDAAKGARASLVIDEEIIEDAAEQMEVDKAIMAGGEAVIGAAYMDVAEALLAAELIDEAHLDAVATAIADAWIAEED